jgi:NAD(P)-dependent dehydrogenase (short-subunit alcohol dehydrogenase family)
MTQREQRVAIVTGGGRGIGAGLVAGYRGQGWAVVANSLKIKPSDDPDVLTVAGDVADPATAEQVVGQGLERFGRIDTLVNNAGVFLSKPFTDYTAHDYALVTSVNLAGFFYMTQRVIPEMLKLGGGHIVNVSAAVAEYADSQSPSVLAALTKGGLAAATKALAVEYARRGIRVNAVAPGVTVTSMHPAEDYAQMSPDEYPPMGRLAQVSDIVGGILSLEAQPFVTGVVLPVDGGYLAGH